MCMHTGFEKEPIVGDTGKKDKNKREQQKSKVQSVKEKRREKREKRGNAPSELGRK